LTEAIAKEGINQRPKNRSRSEMTGMGSMHPGGMNAGFAGGGVQFISKTMKDQHPKAYEGMLDGTAETTE
jgi:prepilin-type processing-associated H-X9-DG protein